MQCRHLSSLVFLILAMIGFLFSLSLFFCLLSHCHALSLSLRAFEHPFFMLLSSQGDGDNDLNEGGWGKERNLEFV